MAIGGIRTKFIATIKHVNGASGSTKTIDWDNGLLQQIAMTDNCTFTLSNPEVGIYRLIINNNDQFGPYTATWPATVKWASGISPTFTKDRFVRIELDYDGINYYANWNEHY